MCLSLIIVLQKKMLRGWAKRISCEWNTFFTCENLLRVLDILNTSLFFRYLHYIGIRMKPLHSLQEITVFYQMAYTALFKKLADGIDIRLQQEVVKIDYTGDDVVVRTKGGEEHKAPKVGVHLGLHIWINICLVFKKFSDDIYIRLPQDRRGC